MLQFLDELKEGYAKADKALGGILPGGGTANPLSDAVRPALEAVAPDSPPIQNYYQEKKNTHIEQGIAAKNELDKARTEHFHRANDSAMETAQNQDEYSFQFRQNLMNDTAGAARVEALENRTARHGIVFGQEYGNGDLTDREFVQEMEANQNLSADEIEQITGYSQDQEGMARMRRDIVRGNDRSKSAKQGASWSSFISTAKGMTTAEGPDAGINGCVYGVNKVIKASGREVPWKDPKTGQESVYIPFVENWITSNGGQQVPREEARPGDIVSNGAHMGILTDKVDGNDDPIVLSNSSSRSSMTYEYPISKYLSTEKDGHKVYRVPQLQN